MPIGGALKLKGGERVTKDGVVKVCADQQSRWPGVGHASESRE